MRDRVAREFRKIQTEARGSKRSERPRWPMIVVRSPTAARKAARTGARRRS
ncbi:MULTISPECIES: hypothetical protein [Bradyrhizobium]|uniref:hypothetical protein n=1 Tax=Bradyrhizobium TaxID=374 RepID=UPI001FCAD9CB|nr:hypothetical protein [Bradyrhizobium elkanii]WLA78879.1 hypothetical protein QNJ99_26020 [Bradyrhizobium elkanii]